MKKNITIEKNLFVLICMCLCLCVRKHKIKGLSKCEQDIAALIPKPTFKNTMKFFVLYVLGIRENTNGKAKSEKQRSQAERDSATLKTIKWRLKRIRITAVLSLSLKIMTQAISEGFRVSVCKSINQLENTFNYKSDKLKELTSSEEWVQIYKVYQTASDSDKTFKKKNFIFSLFNDILRYTFMSAVPSACITSPGSKAGMCHLINIEMLKRFKRIVEPCCRSSAISLYLGKYVEKIVLNDKDSKVAVYLRCLKEQPYYLISTILNVISSEKFNEWMSGKISIKDYKAHVERHMKLPPRKIEGINNRESIEAAAYFFLYINLSFSGNEKMYRKETFLDSSTLGSNFVRMMSASAVLKKAIILNKDCKELLSDNEFGDDTWVCFDPPYIDENGDNDHTYDEQNVDSAYLNNLVELAAEKCKYLSVFHSDMLIANKIMSKHLGLMDFYPSRKGIKTDNDELRYYITNIWAKGFPKTFLN